MAFMVPEAIYGRAYLVDGPCGTDIIPDDVCGTVDIDDDGWTRDNDTCWSPRSGSVADVPTDIAEYCENDRAESVKVVTGWFARLIAPGYLDCTDWSGPYATEAEALSALANDYGTDDDDE